jgi:hypothetical protein
MADELREIIDRLARIEENTKRLPEKIEKIQDNMTTQCQKIDANTRFREEWEDNFKWVSRTALGAIIIAIISAIVAFLGRYGK